MTVTLAQQANVLATRVSEATASASNELQLQHAVEGYLETACQLLGLPWAPFSINVSLRGQGSRRTRFSDAVHGALIIEYKKPGGFRGRDGHLLGVAKNEAQDYAELMQGQEGRNIEKYILVAWDGSHICFGKMDNEAWQWETLTVFDHNQAHRLLRLLQDDGRPLVHPGILSTLVGSESNAGTTLIPALYNVLVDSTRADSATTRTKLLFTEWNRLFGQVIGVQSNQLNRFIKVQGASHGVNYHEHVPQYIMALSTHIALVAKLVAALSLPNSTSDVSNSATDIRIRLTELEDGSLFRDAGIVNILAGDFFSWYLDEVYWDALQQPIEKMVATLQHMDFNIGRKNLATVRDLFKGMYETFMPKALRHGMGEFYTPDWLASHALDNIQWTPGDQLLDPTCGTGTFLLEAIKRRLMLHEETKESPPDAGQLLAGVYGIDLNPLAVLAARASIVIFLSPYISPANPLTIPVWLADAINSPTRVDDHFEHQLLTEKGELTFRVPSSIVENPDFHRIFLSIMGLINADSTAASICIAVRAEFDLDYLTEEESKTLDETVGSLVSLHKESWDGIWCPILADRFTAAAIPRVSHIAGNPPWVKWSHLPSEYANFIKDRCRQSGVFSEDYWFGGIESDISTVITFEAMRKWLQEDGKVAFFITGTVFANESSQGFRKLRYGGGKRAAFQTVEDFNPISPFEGVSNHPTLMMLDNGRKTDYPVKYRVWQPSNGKGQKGRSFNSWEEFTEVATPVDLLAHPVYGTDEGPWLKGTSSQHELWPLMFNTDTEPNYRARKGISTDRNGIFFVSVTESKQENTCSITNNPALGNFPDIQQVKGAIVETDHIFPLIRGEGVHSFLAKTDPDYCVLIPQRTMHGDPGLPVSARHTHRYLARFRGTLEKRSSRLTQLD